MKANLPNINTNDLGDDQAITYSRALRDMEIEQPVVATITDPEALSELVEFVEYAREMADKWDNADWRQDLWTIIASTPPDQPHGLDYCQYRALADAIVLMEHTPEALKALNLEPSDNTQSYLASHPVWEEDHPITIYDDPDDPRLGLDCFPDKLNPSPSGRAIPS